jgi:hypothetical protein
MTGPLKNHRHEIFVQGLLEGKSAIDAHHAAGYARDDANACRLRANPKVVARLTELQSQVAKDTKITVESIVGELTDLAAKATNKSQFTAAIRAVVEKARIAGLLVERVEIGTPGSFENCQSKGAIIDQLLEYTVNPSYHDVRPGDRQALIAMLDRQTAETNAYIESIKRRPYITHIVPAKQLTFNGKARPINGQG